MSWKWINKDVVLALQARQIAEHGGLPGVREMGAVESALARPQNIAAYQEVGASELAGAYAYGFARNHGFNDGNKRMAWLTSRLFLALNGWLLNYDPQEAVFLMQDLAAGKVDEQVLIAWYRARISKPDGG